MNGRVCGDVGAAHPGVGAGKHVARVSWPWPRSDVRHLKAHAQLKEVGSRTAHRSPLVASRPVPRPDAALQTMKEIDGGSRCHCHCQG